MQNLYALDLATSNPIQPIIDNLNIDNPNSLKEAINEMRKNRFDSEQNKMLTSRILNIALQIKSEYNQELAWLINYTLVNCLCEIAMTPEHLKECMRDLIYTTSNLIVKDYIVGPLRFLYEDTLGLLRSKNKIKDQDCQDHLDFMLMCLEVRIVMQGKVDQLDHLGKMAYRVSEIGYLNLTNPGWKQEHIEKLIVKMIKILKEVRETGLLPQAREKLQSCKFSDTNNSEILELFSGVVDCIEQCCDEKKKEDFLAQAAIQIAGKVKSNRNFK